MAMRNKVAIDIIWVLLDVTHPSYSDAIKDLRTQHETKGSFSLDINTKKDGLEALVKLVGRLSPWVRDQPWAGATKRTYTEADHHLAVVLVRKVSWEVPELREPSLRRKTPSV